MLRWAVLILLLAIAAVLAGTLAASPGTMALEWGGYRVASSFAVFALVLAALLVASALIYRLLWSLRRAPRAFALMQRERRRRRGYEALSRGLVAVAAGDNETAERQSRRAERLLDEPPLTMLLAAQSAQLRGDDQAASRFFEAMRERPETEFLGLRGLLTTAMKRHDWQQSLELAERAYRLNPKSEWVLSTLYELKKREGAWDEAEELLERSLTSTVLPPPDAAREHAELLYKKSQESSGGDAIRWAQKALRIDPAYVPAAVRLARLLVSEGRYRRAAEIIQRTWAHSPDPELADVYWQATQSTDALKKVKAAQQLAKVNPDHIESRITVAVAALEARLWGEARSQLEAIAGEDAPPRVCRLMATLEEQEHGDIARARIWLMRAAGEEHAPQLAPPPAAVSSPEAERAAALGEPPVADREPLDERLVGLK